MGDGDLTSLAMGFIAALMALMLIGMMSTMLNMASDYDTSTEVSTEVIASESIIENESITNSNISEQVSEIIATEMVNENNNEQNSNKVDIEEFTSAYEDMDETLKSVTSLLMHILLAIVPIILIFQVLKILLNRDYEYGISFSESYPCDDCCSSKTTYDLFYDVIKEKRDMMLSNKLINTAILQSEKNISKEDFKFLQDCIEVKNEWYSYKKDIKEIDKNQKLYAVLVLDVLSNINKIKDFFESGDENKCLGMKDKYECSIGEYLNNEENYFKIDKNYYLKEVVFYVLTNNNLRIKELYDYISNEKTRANITYVIANLIEGELSLEDDMSISNTLEESVNIFNSDYKLSLNVNMAKNLIYLSKYNNDKDLEKKLLEKTSILDDMKNFRHYLYA